MASKSKFECELWSSLVSRVVDETRPDVIFKIVEGDLSSEIQAHKHVLGMVSLTFRNMFRNMPAEVIEIKETTEQAFGVMVDAVYNKSPIEASLADKSVDEIFAVVNLAKIYMISELMEDLKQFISSFPLTDETLLVVAAEAMEYRNLFEEEAGHLLLTCANYLKPKLMDARSIFRYVDENVANKEVVATLLAMMNNIAPTGCHNCQKDPCQNGAGVKANEFRVGLIVTNSTSSGAKVRVRGTGAKVGLSRWALEIQSRWKALKVDCSKLQIHTKRPFRLATVGPGTPPFCSAANRFKLIQVV